MQFQKPEILYFLLLLLIPIIVHLFQLRRFQKVDFTNVAFLKKATLQTRKSSQLKKWLTLLTRLLALACIILAFAQPFTANETALNSKKETVLYLDNSFSMQLKGPNGPMLERAKQQLYEKVNSVDKIAWFTNDELKRAGAASDFKSEVLQIDYTQEQLSINEVFLKANQLFSKDKDSDKRLLIISDFQQQDIVTNIPEDISIQLVKTTPVKIENIAIDTAYIESKSTNSIELAVQVSKNGEAINTTSVSLWNGVQLIAKSAVEFNGTNTNILRFTIQDFDTFEGRLSIEDSQLGFDNSLYFCINKPSKIKVLSVNEGNSEFLQRLFENASYNYTQYDYNNLNYSDLPNQNLIILNELKTFEPPLITALNSCYENGGSIFIIPSSNANITTYNTLLSSLKLGAFSEKNSETIKKIAKINFSHPLYANVFEKQISNFQYPTTKTYFEITGAPESILNFEDGKPFLVQDNNAYLTTAPFDKSISNFKNSPLIVPSLLNMAQQSLALPELYYTINEVNEFAVPITLMQDEILNIKDSLNTFIPLQQAKSNKVEITTLENPKSQGNFEIVLKDSVLQKVSYNFNRNESKLTYFDPSNWEGVQYHNDVTELFENLSELNRINDYWKWFVIFAIVFLVFEMFILKFFK